MAASQIGVRASPTASHREAPAVSEQFYRALPGELWGAFNLLAGVAKSCATKPSSLVPEATLGASADFSYSQEEDQDQDGGKSQQQSLRERLDYRPRLSAVDVCLCAVLPAAICAAFYFGIRPARLTWLYTLGLSLIYAAWVAICRALLLERHYTARLVDARDLADRDSKFTELDGVSVHYKVHHPPSRTPAVAVHCYHGFGANTGSWDPVQPQLAARLSAVVTSHDMPGFGLTGRPSDVSKYSLAFNGHLGRQLLGHELANAQTGKKGNVSEASTPHDSADPSPKSEMPQVLMGHSLGAACATAEALKHPEGIKGLVLVAPAVIAFAFAMPQPAGKSGKVLRDTETLQAQFGRPATQGRTQRRPKQKNLMSRLAIALSQAVLKLTSGFWTRLLQPVTIVSLRSAVRSRSFWERGLRRAWHDKAGVKPHIVDAYRRPQLVRGWEKGLINFTTARMAGGKGFVTIIKDACKGEVKPTQAEELAELVTKHRIKVLIVHGDKDNLVPLSNSVRLAALLPDADFKVMKNAGHVPHEERPHEFIDLVDNFIQTLR